MSILATCLVTLCSLPTPDLTLPQPLTTNDIPQARKQFLCENQSTNYLRAVEAIEVLFCVNYSSGFRADIKSIDDYPHGNWVVSFTVRNIFPQFNDIRLITNTGEVLYADSENTEKFVKAVYPGELSTKNRNAAIDLFRYLTKSGNVIDSLEDIPEYAVRPFNEAQEMIFKEAIAISNTQTNETIVTYDAMRGGKVCRYDFGFNNNNELLKASVTILATGIGAARYRH